MKNLEDYDKRRQYNVNFDVDGLVEFMVDYCKIQLI